MCDLTHSPDILATLEGRTAIITGAARGIGGATAALFNEHGANVVIADLPGLQKTAESLIKTMKQPEKALFVSASVTDWLEMVNVFKQTVAKFGKVDIVVANAGIMESHSVLDVSTDENGDPIESSEAIKVLDVNLKGAFNTLRLGLHYMSTNQLLPDLSRGSIVLVASTSGYFGTTGNAAYISAKHGVVGLLRASQQKAKSLKIRVNAIAPSFTPTHITAGFGDSVAQAGLETNTLEWVGGAIAAAAIDDNRTGTCCLVAGKYLRELEQSRQKLVPQWLGPDLARGMADFGSFLINIGGYRLPQNGTSLDRP